MNRLFPAIWILILMSVTSSLSAPANLVPTGTMRAAFIATNPVQGIVDARTDEVRGLAGEISREIGRRLGVPVKVTGAAGVPSVLNAARSSGLIKGAIERAGLVGVDIAPPPSR